MKCEHTEHAHRSDGLVGRYFKDGKSYWIPCDSEMGEYVYCGSHLRPHVTGWCSVPTREKIALQATTRDEAYAEAEALVLKVI